MSAFSSSAPGKIILFGEHAVVYGQPAIAVPVSQVRATVTVTPNPAGEPGDVRILAPAVGLDSPWARLAPENPVGAALRGVASALGVDAFPACTFQIVSTIPVASGLGSGAAVSVAVIRAAAEFLGHPLPDEQVSALAFEIEKIHHGTPSGIDNTVVAYAQPVCFVRGQPVELFTVARPFTLVIGDTGVAALTKESVGDVRKGWQADALRYERLFTAIRGVAQAARAAIEAGTPVKLGSLMDENHALLQKLEVSSPALDRLVGAAKAAGALGAKLSGGGRGGNMIALVEPGDSETVAAALLEAGAVNTIITEVH